MDPHIEKKNQRKRKQDGEAGQRLQKAPRPHPSPFDGIIGRVHIQMQEECDDQEGNMFDPEQYSESEYSILVHRNYMDRIGTNESNDISGDFRRNRTSLSRDAAQCKELFDEKMDELAARIINSDTYIRNIDERVRAPIADMYTRWQAENHDVLQHPSLHTDPCLLFGKETRKFIAKEQPFRDFRQFIATVHVALRHKDKGLSYLDDHRISAIKEMGFMRGSIQRNPDPRFKAKFFIMTGKHRPFGLYLFSNNENMLVYFMYVSEQMLF